jgi:drug/metabolite transporter (DMT)-like permease
VAVALGAIAQIILKRGMTEPEFQLPGGPVANTITIAQAFLRPLVFVGIVLYVVSTFFWLVVLSRAPLNVAYPMISLGYVLVVLLSALLLNEKVALTTGAGLILICGGVVLIGLGASGPK